MCVATDLSGSPRSGVWKIVEYLEQAAIVAEREPASLNASRTSSRQPQSRQSNPHAKQLIEGGCGEGQGTGRKHAPPTARWRRPFSEKRSGFAYSTGAHVGLGSVTAGL